MGLTQVKPKTTVSTHFCSQYERVVVEYFDFITIAISKIIRFQACDVSDVILLVQQGSIEKREIDDAVQEVAQKMGFGHYTHLDVQTFPIRYRTIKSRF